MVESCICRKEKKKRIGRKMAERRQNEQGKWPKEIKVEANGEKGKVRGVQD